MNLRSYLAFAVLLLPTAASRADDVIVPRIDGEWWRVAGNPDLGELTGEKQQPVDFAVWQAADGTWQLWSCTRHTKEPGGTRLFHRWEGEDLHDTGWKPMGIARRADTDKGERLGVLQAPYVKKIGGKYYLFYNSGGAFVLVSDDGKTFREQPNHEGGRKLFDPDRGVYGRDLMVAKFGDLWHCYYGGSYGKTHEEHVASIFCRTAPHILGPWGPVKRVNWGGKAGSKLYNAECPHVVVLDGWYYLFRTELYGKFNKTHVYRSKDPLDFGGDTDRCWVASLPVAAPEIIRHDGQDYIAALTPELDGVRIAKLKWVPRNSD